MQSVKYTYRRALSAAAVFFLFSLSAHATSVVVGTCLSGMTQYSTIHDAVSHSPAGAVINVCPVSYAEQVVINKSITLRGVTSGGQNAAVILPPNGGMVQNATDVDGGTPIAAQVLVQSGVTVSITDLVVDGTNNGIGSCSPDLQGVLFQNASGTLNHVTVRNQYLATQGGCQSGEGIYVQTASGQTSNVLVENSSVHDYQKNGITGNDAGTTLTVSHTRVQGFGVVQPPGAAQNGTQLGFGAQGSILDNFIVDNVYGDSNVAIATGILLYDSAENKNIQVNGNTVGNTQGAVVLVTDQPGVFGDGVTVMSNNLFATVNYDAIDACTNGNTIKNNSVYDSSQSAIHLDASCGTTGNNNSVSGNMVNDSGCAGVLEDGGITGTNLGTNMFYGVPNTVLSGTCPTKPGYGSRMGRGGKGIYNPKGRN